MIRVIEVKDLARLFELLLLRLRLITRVPVLLQSLSAVLVSLDDASRGYSTQGGIQRKRVFVTRGTCFRTIWRARQKEAGGEKRKRKDRRVASHATHGGKSSNYS